MDWFNSSIFLLAVSILLISISNVPMAYLVAAFMAFIAIRIVIEYIKNKNQDRNTFRKGEKCFARVLDCKLIDKGLGNKKQFEVYMVFFVPSLNKRLIGEEIIGNSNYEYYSQNSYFNVLYLDNNVYNNIMYFIIKIKINYFWYGHLYGSFQRYL